jgi:hypothetical protein
MNVIAGATARAWQLDRLQTPFKQSSPFTRQLDISTL